MLSICFIWLEDKNNFRSLIISKLFARAKLPKKFEIKIFQKHFLTDKLVGNACSFSVKHVKLKIGVSRIFSEFSTEKKLLFVPTYCNS